VYMGCHATFGRSFSGHSVDIHPEAGWGKPFQPGNVWGRREFVPPLTSYSRRHIHYVIQYLTISLRHISTCLDVR